MSKIFHPIVPTNVFDEENRLQASIAQQLRDSFTLEDGLDTLTTTTAPFPKHRDSSPDTSKGAAQERMSQPPTRQKRTLGPNKKATQTTPPQPASMPCKPETASEQMPPQWSSTTHHQLQQQQQQQHMQHQVQPNPFQSNWNIHQSAPEFFFHSNHQVQNYYPHDQSSSSFRPRSNSYEWNSFDGVASTTGDQNDPSALNAAPALFVPEWPDFPLAGHGDDLSFSTNTSSLHMSHGNRPTVHGLAPPPPPPSSASSMPWIKSEFSTQGNTKPGRRPSLSGVKRRSTDDQQRNGKVSRRSSTFSSSSMSSASANSHHGFQQLSLDSLHPHSLNLMDLSTIRQGGSSPTPTTTPTSGSRRVAVRWMTPGHIRLLDHVAKTLQNNERNVRWWKQCAMSWNESSSHINHLTNDDMKMKVKQMTKERQNRHQAKWWKEVRTAKSLEEIKDKLITSLDEEEQWPIDSIAEFIWTRNNRGSGKGSSRGKALHGRGYCTLLSWDEPVRMQLLEKILELHKRFGMCFSQIHKGLSKVVPLFDIELAVLSNCNCAGCSMWGISSITNVGEATLEFTKQKCKLLSDVLREQQRLNVTDPHILFEEIQQSGACPKIKDWNVAEFIEFIEPISSGIEAGPGPMVQQRHHAILHT